MSDVYLVTGGSGYLAGFVLLNLLEQGAKIKTTLLFPEEEAQLRESLYSSSDNLTKEIVDANLKVYQADVTSDDHWTEIFQDVNYVLHLASPFPLVPPKDPNDLIIPAREGTLRIIRFASKTNTVKHMVATSSFVAIGFGHEKPVFTEEDWTDTEKVDAYPLSKTLAERAAWEYIKSTPVKFGYTTINPVLMIGPSLKKQVTNSTSLNIIKSMFDGTNKDGVRPETVHLVDIRDAAKLHIKALTNKKASGQRILVASGPTITWVDVANVLRTTLPEKYHINLPTRETGPSEVRKILSIEKAKRIFNWTPIPFEESLAEAAKGIIQEGKV
ncbi:cinnamoyl-Coa reductase [Scheffersomyces stipitis CBS 6054]|uniref:Cinnamoyl-Coa reductase n=1 Tax=Scheffersomyces stipitis (strain ATCC 58785 / CBS 6054 / NBRC 10063 / NRRL Y-11545) TaxID=322104 RepID=A3LSP8_PICST|nr:cinnamoyl-Coa reductase [Scheffersomyces stipitis CBS 6054]ABN65934.1 cinnamoyl-Coa reductase [Scheffersomyces stipitis CBS 6054]KAG2733499.1 hypothetical protein G9P44_003024 [Scheffersomyces stipitis]